MTTGLLPLFPLGSVLFPEALLPLRIFEARYTDLAARCMKNDEVFGVCLIAQGTEVGAPAVPHELGVSARIVSWDMEPGAVLHVVVRGERRFRVRRTETGANGLLEAEVEWLPATPAQALPEDMAPLLPLLHAVLADAGPERFPPPHRFDDAEWVGLRYAEILPIQALARQRLLELDDPLSRLEIIRSYLTQRGVLKAT